MIQLIVMDVDGTLTDGSVYYNEAGIETKKFSVKDGAGIVAAQAVGIPCMILTGRESWAVKRRAEDLRIQYVYQGIKDKAGFLQEFLQDRKIDANTILFIGDDFNDMKAMRMAGMVGCPADAAAEVRKLADYISDSKGGYGAFRDIIFHYLRAEGKYEAAIEGAFGGI